MIKHSIFLILISFSLSTHTSCIEKPSEKREAVIANEKFVCRGKTYSSDDEYLRVQGFGSSRNEQMAKRKAHADANANLAKLVSLYRQGLSGENSKQQELSDADKNETPRHSRELINETLVNVRIICEETTFEDGIYNVIVLVEMAVINIDLDKKLISQLIFK